MDAPDAIVVVDVQRAFPVPEKLLKAIERETQKYRTRIFTRFVNPEGSLFRKVLKMDSCPPGSADLHLVIPPKKGDLVFNKQGYGLSPGHIAKLKRRRIRKVAVCGIDTDACVLGVMFSLFDRGIDCRVIPELCYSTSGKVLHRAAMRVIGNQFPPPSR
jgi:nicotinamidase-related amidase